MATDHSHHGSPSGPNRCGNCGAHVNPDTRRVLAGPDGELEACPNCTERTNLCREAVGLEPREHVQDWRLEYGSP